MSRPAAALLLVLASAVCCTPKPDNRAGPGMWYPEEILTAAERRSEADEKAARVVRWLEANGMPAVTFGDRAAVDWLTGGVVGEASGPLAVEVTKDGRRRVWCPGSDLGRLSDEDLAETGWELAAVPESAAALPATAQALDSLRDPPTAQELKKYRWLGRRAAEAVERVCAGLERFMTERGIEALLSDALMRHAIRPAGIVVASDDRIAKYRLPPPAEKKKVEEWALVRVVAERWALRVSLTRIVHFGALPEETRRNLEAAARVGAEYWAWTRPGASADEALRAAESAYREAGFAEEYRRQPQRGVLNSSSLYAWTPGVRGVTLEDTVLLDGEKFEVLTQTRDWPRVEAQAAGRTYRLPGILIR